MSNDRIVVKYHNRRMLLTVDLEHLFITLFNTFGDGVRIAFMEMNDGERVESSEIIEGIRAIRERFWILETTEVNEIRRKDLERSSIAGGKK